MPSFPHVLHPPFCGEDPHCTLSPLVFISPNYTLSFLHPLPFSLALTFKEQQENPSSMRWCCFHEIHAAVAPSILDVSLSPCPPSPLISTQVQGSASVGLLIFFFTNV